MLCEICIFFLTSQFVWISGAHNSSPNFKFGNARALDDGEVQLCGLNKRSHSSSVRDESTRSTAAGTNNTPDSTSIIGEKLTDGWMLRALPLAHEFPVTGDGDAVQLAQGRM